MGLAKRQMEEEFERGWSSIGKDICTDCVTNPALKEIVEENLEVEKCDHCGRTADEPIAADTDHVMEQIGESFASAYADPIEELPYESREGGYQGNWFDTWECVDEAPAEGELALVLSGVKTAASTPLSLDHGPRSR